MRKAHDKIMGPVLNAADDRIRFTKICLGMARRMAQRHVHLPLTLPGGKNIILHDGDATGKAILITKPLKDPLRRMTLLLQTFGIVLKDLVDNTDKRIKLGPVRRLLAAIARWGRERQHLINRATVNAEQPCRFAAAHTLNFYRITHATIQFHLLHPRPLQKAESLPLADFYSGQQPDNLAASVVDYCSGVLRSHAQPGYAGHDGAGRYQDR